VDATDLRGSSASAWAWGVSHCLRSSSSSAHDLHRVVQHDPVVVTGEVALHDLYGPRPLPGAQQGTRQVEQQGKRPLGRRLVDGGDLVLQPVRVVHGPVGVGGGDPLHGVGDPEPDNLVGAEVTLIELGKPRSIRQDQVHDIDRAAQQLGCPPLSIPSNGSSTEWPLLGPSGDAISAG